MNKRDKATYTRREFLGKTMQFTIAGSAAITGVQGCAGMATYHRVPVNGVLNVNLSDMPDLRIKGKGVMLDAGAAGPIILINRESGFKAISAVCAHLGCTVRAGRNGFRCPCHGSAYNADGKVVRGPAQSDLETFETELEGDIVKIYLESKGDE